MKTKALMVIVFLLLCSAILASGNDSEAEEYWRKTQELNQMAERFKAETGFVGDIGYSYQAMGFTNYRGNFRDIPVTVPQDTVAMGQVFEQVLTKVKPYIRAREGQLVREAIVSYVNSTYVTYRQRVNGYGVVGAGVLRIDYNIPTSEIIVTDNTVNILNDYVIPVLTNEDVISIYTTTVPDDEILNMFSNRSPRFRLSYCNIYKYQFEKSPEYRLCWVGGSTRELVIDSISGEIYVNELSVIHDITVNVAGTALLDSDNNCNLQATSADFFGTRVYANCDGNDTNFVDTDILGNAFFQGSQVTNIRAHLKSNLVTFFDGSCNPAPQFIQYPSAPLNPTIMFDYYNYVGNPSNQYYHSIKYLKWLSDNVISSPLFFPLDIATGCTMPEQGKYYPQDSLIRINHESGMYSSTICHEMIHALVYQQFNSDFFNPFPPNVHNEML